MAVITHDSMRKQIYEYLKEQMNAGKLKPGRLINQRELSVQLGVSRTPLRDTMIQLEAEGFLEIVPCKGIFIKQLTLQDIKEYFVMGGILEGKAAELGLPYYDERDISEMNFLIAEALKKISKGDLSFANEDNRRFNDIIIKRCPNQKIADSLLNIREQLYHFRKQDPTPAAPWELQIWKEHQTILKHIRKKTGKELNAYIANVHWKIDEEYIKNRFLLGDSN